MAKELHLRVLVKMPGAQRVKFRSSTICVQVFSYLCHLNLRTKTSPIKMTFDKHDLLNIIYKMKGFVLSYMSRDVGITYPNYVILLIERSLFLSITYNSKPFVHCIG